MSLRKYPPGITRVDSTGRAARLRRRRAEAAAVVHTPPVGVVAAAIAERSSGKPLVVESFEEKLRSAIPGATLCRLNQSDSWWCVARDARILAVAASKREAVDKAIALFGGQR